MSNVDKLEQILKEQFQPKFLKIEDQSAQHAGHDGARNGGGHYKVVLISPVFKGKSLVEQHQMVYQALENEMKQEIHALALKTAAE